MLIGPNASGKSNLIQVFEFIRAAASGRLRDFVDREGGMGRLVWDGQDDHISLRLTTTTTEDGEDRLIYGLQLNRLGASGYTIVLEGLWNGVQASFLERDDNSAVIYSDDLEGIGQAVDSLDDEETLLSVAGGPLASNRLVAEFQKHLLEWTLHHDFTTHRDSPVRQPVITRFDTRLADNGHNLISFLHTVYSSNRQFKRELDLAMRAAFDEQFDELVFPPASDQRVQLRVRWKGLSYEQSTADLSDGTLRFLFLLAILGNPSPPALIAIEEPETGLHPAMLPIVAEYAVEAAQRSQILLTTHSPAFLDAFGREVPTTTVVEWRDGESHLKVPDRATLDHWLSSYSLGEMFLANDLEAIA